MLGSSYWGVAVACRCLGEAVGEQMLGSSFMVAEAGKQVLGAGVGKWVLRSSCWGAGV